MRTGQFISSRGDRVNINNAAIVITDGVSTMDKNNTIPEAIRAHNDNIKVTNIIC